MIGWVVSIPRTGTPYSLITYARLMMLCVVLCHVIPPTQSSSAEVSTLKSEPESESSRGLFIEMAAPLSRDQLLQPSTLPSSSSSSSSLSSSLPSSVQAPPQTTESAPSQQPLATSSSQVPSPPPLTTSTTTTATTTAAQSDQNCPPFPKRRKLRPNNLLRLGVILPFTGSYPWALPRTLPAILIAVDKVTNQSALLPNFTVHVTSLDSQCSETMGPLAAIDMYFNQSADVFLGPACAYSVAPVARFSHYWGIPVLTAGGLVTALRDKTEYKMLTRVQVRF